MNNVKIVRHPFDSILEAVFTVSPNRQYLGIFVPTTPAHTNPINEETPYQRNSFRNYSADALSAWALQIISLSKISLLQAAAEETRFLSISCLLFQEF